MPTCTRVNTRISSRDKKTWSDELHVLDDAIVTEDRDSINIDLDGDGNDDIEIDK